MSEGSISTAKSGGKTGLYLGCAGILLGLIAFFWQPLVMSIAGIVLGLIGVLATPYKNIGMPAVIIGVIALLLGVVPHP